MDSLRFFSVGKNLRLLLLLFLLILMVYLHFFVFILLAEKFQSFTMQQINYLCITSSLTGYVTFFFGLFRAPRRLLNFLVSGGFLLLSAVMLAASGLLDRYSLDSLGLICMCKSCSADDRLIASFGENSGGLWFFVLLFVHHRAAPVIREGLRLGSHCVCDQPE